MYYLKMLSFIKLTLLMASWSTLHALLALVSLLVYEWGSKYISCVLTCLASLLQNPFSSQLNQLLHHRLHFHSFNLKNSFYYTTHLMLGAEILSVYSSFSIWQNRLHKSDLTMPHLPKNSASGIQIWCSESWKKSEKSLWLSLTSETLEHLAST